MTCNDSMTCIGSMTPTHSTMLTPSPGEPLGWRQSLAPKLLPEKEKKKEVAQLSCKSKREEERGEHHKEWQEQYDKPMPEVITP